MAKRSKMRSGELRAVGVTCGIGSMLVGARAAGFRVLGNIEWRKYYHAQDGEGRNTFTENFSGAVFPHRVDDLPLDIIEKLMGADLAIGHPECGRYSLLDGQNKKRARERGLPDRGLDAGDIPLFTDLVGKLKPRYFVMDDLPKSLEAFPMFEYNKRLEKYDLFPEWVSNWGYGNVQRQRNRMFMLGARKEERWVFRPGERDHQTTVADVIGDLVRPVARGNVANHHPHDMRAECYRALNLGGYGKRSSWDDVREYWAQQRMGQILHYTGPDGLPKCRIGFVKGHWDEGQAHVLTGNNPTVHAIRGEPYTIRERARIQGFPDDFVFYGEVLNDRGEWNQDKNGHLIKQTGKAMPVQFCEYVSRQVAAKIRGEVFESPGERLLSPDPHVSEAKRWYCQNVGYSDQRGACGQCWMYSRCTIRLEKYDIGEKLDGRGDLHSGHLRVAHQDGAPRDKEKHRRADAGRRRGAREEPRGVPSSKRATRFGDAPKPVDVEF